MAQRCRPVRQTGSSASGASEVSPGRKHHAGVPRRSSAEFLRHAPGEYGGYKRPPRLQVLVVAFLIAWAGVIALYAAAYGTLAAVWNLKRSPPSYVGALVSITTALACPIDYALDWRVGYR